MSKKELNIGLFGFGCVGSGLYQVLNQSKLLKATILKIVVKDKTKKRELSAENFSFEANDILENDAINVVVELIDDSNAAFDIVSKALKNGKHVVSANKKLIAEHLDELIALARENKVSFIYEAAVAGAIPILRNLEEYYNNDSLSGIEAIANGTTNYILTKTSQGLSYADALSQAQELGFAESDPTLDVDAFDPKYKLLILVKHAFGLSLNEKEIFNYGIRQLKPQDIKYTQEKGLRIKLLARSQKIGNKIVAFVAPHFVSNENFAYNVNNEFNAVMVEALFSDKQLFLGKGAGSFPTASAVLSDISALQFDYNYEYKKEESAKDLAFSNDVFVKVYLASPTRSELEKFEFAETDEEYYSQNYNYKTGYIHLESLTKINFNDQENLFFSVLEAPFLEKIGSKDFSHNEVSLAQLN
jgi:homoserine dehydrogenase